jgi:23S rRNA pseudouridine1911/1915/1917 synthase
MQKISIVYEDSDLLVINKPAGLLTHPVNRTDTSESVVSWVLEKYPEIKNVTDKHGESLGQWVDLRPGIVHRLDKETSGLMIIAKTQPAFDFLKKQFQEHKIKKTYLALVVGKMKNESGRIETSVGKIGTKQTTQIHGKRDLKEKTAITDYKVISSYSLPTTHYSLLEVQPQTGRTHQIRIHLKSIGHPIVGDQLYGSSLSSPRRSSKSSEGGPPELGRLFLHAQKLSFTLPPHQNVGSGGTPSGEALTLETDLPPELQNFLDNLPKN